MFQKNDSYSGNPVKPENLLIVRTDRIGDLVLSLPLAEIVKKHYPNCKVTFLLRNYTKDIAYNHPFIDNVIILKEENKKIPLKENIEKLKKLNFDSAIIVYPTFIISLIIFLSRIRKRIGTGYRWYSFLFNYKFYEHRKYALKHELEYNVNLLKAFGIEEEIDSAKTKFHLQLNEISQEKVRKILTDCEVDLEKPLIIVHPGSGGSAVDLPLEKFKELVQLISSKLNTAVILSGTESEKELCTELQLNNNIKNLAGLLNLSELIALINESDIFIANSTGPIHLAAALGKYTIGFYPYLKACSAKRWGPYTEKKTIFSPEIKCIDCEREQCDKIDCMKSIKVTEIFAEVEKIYNLISN